MTRIADRSPGVPLSLTTVVVGVVALVASGCQDRRPLAPDERPDGAEAAAVTPEVSSCSAEFTVDPTFSDRTVFGRPFSGWQETGVTLEAGDPVSLAATGTVCLVAGLPWTCYGPEGSGLIPEEEGFAQFLAPAHSHGGLVGRIGTGEPFLVSPTHHAPVSPDGTLFLGVNDSQVDDNTGSFDVSILINPAEECQAGFIRDMVDILEERGSLNAGEATSLRRKLNTARDLFERGNEEGASGALRSFVRELEGLIRTGRLAPSEGGPLIDAAGTVTE